MNENALTQKILKHINSIPRCFARKRHGGAFSQGDPDIAGVIEGLAFFCEVKLETGELTKLQAVMLDKWKFSGAKTFVAIYDFGKRQLRIVSRKSSYTWLAIAGPVSRISGGFLVDLTPQSVLSWIETVRCSEQQDD
jgi:hypothetical protein